MVPVVATKTRRSDNTSNVLHWVKHQRYVCLVCSHVCNSNIYTQRKAPAPLKRGSRKRRIPQKTPGPAPKRTVTIREVKAVWRDMISRTRGPPSGLSQLSRVTLPDPYARALLLLLTQHVRTELTDAVLRHTRSGAPTSSLLVGEQAAFLTRLLTYSEARRAILEHYRALSPVYEGEELIARLAALATAAFYPTSMSTYASSDDESSSGSDADDEKSTTSSSSQKK